MGGVTACKVRDWLDVATPHDIGDGAVVFEVTRPDALVPPETIAAPATTESLVLDGFHSLILTSGDSRLFAFGAAGSFAP